MRHYQFDNNHFYQSSHFHNPKESDRFRRYEFNRLTKTFLRRNLFQELIKSYNQYHDLEGLTLLIAHGKRGKRPWSFVDGNRLHIMQNWIDKIDGETSPLLLCTCNYYQKNFLKNHLLIHL